ncbi:TPA: hypothetical protein ACJEU7_002389 [Acinetobacter baumannii]|uniref:hypothetical protein n=1 Tax=Acinetobacter baumannii TaxID=470 RepID=UPI00124AA3C8|nr:hypothetical protein [Acinetobacter baumannii]KAB1665075.1 hypothetical protein F8B05_19270 [Acinetobacter baumannii]MCX3034155.1 hypothetical protein [Acinetobacter baumannii]
MPNFNDIKLTAAQKKKFEALQKAHEECLKSGIQFLSFDEHMYPVNGKKIESIDPTDIVPVTNDEKQFSDIGMPKGWDKLHVEEPYCQTSVTFTLL